MKNVWYYDFPIGKIGIVGNEVGITDIFFANDKLLEDATVIESGIIKLAAKQLSEYFNRERKIFDIPLSVIGTDFQKLTWSALQTIPYGQTCSYKEIAQKIGNPKSCRAVGGANNKNPICIVIPCHRVIGKNGSMVGYAAGINIKKYLLDLEKSE